MAVTGLGAVSGFGAGVEALWAALLDGGRAMAERAELAAAGLEVGPVALVPELPLSATDRAARLALTAAREALGDAGEPARTERLGLVLGTTLGGLGGWLRAVRGDDSVGGGSVGGGSVGVEDGGGSGASPRRWTWAGPAHALAETLGIKGPLEVTSVACASGNAALGTALDLLRDGSCDVVLAGGVDALHDFVLSGFASLKALDDGPCRPFDRRRRGLNLGEGAAFLVLEREAHARARSARIRAFLDGYGISADAVHMTGPDREGRGAARAMQHALADAGLTAAEVGYVSAHGTATLFNDLMEAKALALALGPHAPSVPVNSVKGALGHTLGAAGALEAVLCVRTLETGLVPPTPGLEERDPEIPLQVVHGAPLALPARGWAALSTSSGFGGTNAAIVLTRA